MQKAETVRYQPQWFQNRRLIIGILACFLVAILGIQLKFWSVVTLVLIIQIIFFILAFRRPVWAMAALLVGQFTASNYILTLSAGTQISVRLLWTIMAVLIMIPLLKVKGGIKLGRGIRSVIIPAAIFFVLATIANVVNLDTANIYPYLRTGVTALAILFFLPALVKNEKDLKLLAIVILIICTISSLAAVMQHYQYLGMPVITLSGDTIIPQNRTPGLAASPLYLSYELSIVILPMFALFFMKGVSRSARIALTVSALVMVAALYFTYTRSGMYSIIPGIMVMVLFLKGKMRKELLLIFIVITVSFLLYINITNNRYSRGFNDESSAAGRLVLWKAGIMIALDNPVVGIGQGRFMEISQLYSGDVGSSAVPGAEGVLGTQQNHNDFIRVWDSFGTPALLAYLWVFVSTFRNFYYGYRRSTGPFLKAMALGGFAALISYVVSAFMHNLMDSVPIFWILAGFSIAFVKLAEAPKPVTERVKAINVPEVKLLPDRPAPEP